MQEQLPRRQPILGQPPRLNRIRPSHGGNHPVWPAALTSFSRDISFYQCPQLPTHNTVPRLSEFDPLLRGLWSPKHQIHCNDVPTHCRRKVFVTIYVSQRQSDTKYVTRHRQNN